MKSAAEFESRLRQLVERVEVQKRRKKPSSSFGEIKRLRAFAKKCDAVADALAEDLWLSEPDFDEDGEDVPGTEHRRRMEPYLRELADRSRGCANFFAEGRARNNSKPYLHYAAREFLSLWKWAGKPLSLSTTSLAVEKFADSFFVSPESARKYLSKACK